MSNKIFNGGIKPKTVKSLVADAYVLAEQKKLNIAFMENFTKEIDTFLESDDVTFRYTMIKTNNDGSTKSKEQITQEITAIICVVTSSAYKKAVKWNKKASGKGIVTIDKRKAVSVTDDCYNAIMD